MASEGFTIRCFERPLDAPTHAATALARTFIAGVREGCPANVAVEALRKVENGADHFVGLGQNDVCYGV